MNARRSLFVVVMTMAATVTVGAQEFIVIRVAERAIRKDSTVEILTLPSGQKVEVPRDDIEHDLTKTVNEAIQHLSTMPPTSKAPGDPASEIRAKCSNDWPGDFRMRAHCETQQKEAHSALSARAMVGSELATIRTKCSDDWPVDFRMRNYCETRQVEALKSLGR